jgi:hypothetical protein
MIASYLLCFIFGCVVGFGAFGLWFADKVGRLVSGKPFTWRGRIVRMVDVKTQEPAE